MLLPSSLIVRALNHLLADADWARRRLRPFAGRSARISFPPLLLELRIDDAGCLVRTRIDAAADVEIDLPAATPLRLVEGAEALVGAAKIRGAADFADALGFVLRNLRWDLEADLARLVGDIAARRLAGLFAAFGAWQREAVANAAGNLVEYLVHEQPALADPREAATLADQVAALRDDLARLDQRIQRLTG